MKTLIIALFTFISFVGLEINQEKITVQATFDEYEDETYYFSDEKEGAFEFQKVDEVEIGRVQTISSFLRMFSKRVFCREV